MSYMSESAKVRDMPHVMQYIIGARIADVGCGGDKIVPRAIGFDGRALNGVDVISTGTDLKYLGAGMKFDTIFSSHFLEHIPDPYSYIASWCNHLVQDGYLVLYLPEKTVYNSFENPEHMFNWSFDDFMFWFKRCFCGEGKDFRGQHLPKVLELIECGLDIGPDRYSFYLISKKL